MEIWNVQSRTLRIATVVIISQTNYTITHWGRYSFYYFYQMLNPLNKWKIMSEVVLLLPNTNHLQQVEDCVRLYYFYQMLTTFNEWRYCHMLCYFYQILTTFNKWKIMSEVVLFLPKYWPTSERLCQRLHMTIGKGRLANKILTIQTQVQYIEWWRRYMYIVLN